MKKFSSAAEAVQIVESGNRIYIHGIAAAPQALIKALTDRAPELRGVEIVHLHTEGPAPYAAPEMAASFRVNALFISKNIRQAVQEGRADFTSVFLSEVPSLFTDGTLPLDVCLITVSPPDRHGFCSLGTSVEATRAAMLASKHVIAQVNKFMPRTHGDGLIHVNNLTGMFHCDEPLPEVIPGAPTETEAKIGKFVAELIDNGATIQMGIGAIPNAVLDSLKSHKDLGVHSEMFTDGLIDLVESGVVNVRKKKIHPGKIVAGFILGTRKLYEWANDNPMVEMHPTEYVNDPFIIAQNDRMVAVNSAIEVDLTGQVCADSIGPKLYSGVGGQLDFIYGASRSKGGVPIIALPSVATLRDGTQLSKITAMLKPGAGVVTSRNHVRFVVTEHGVADLYGKTIRQRAQALIKVAHPQFHEDLQRQARELHYA